MSKLLLARLTNIQVRKVHTLVDGSNGSDNGAGKEDGSPGVSAVTWNATGSVVAVAYAHAEHGDWCDHSTSLAVWNVNRRDFDPSRPYQVWATRAKGAGPGSSQAMSYEGF